MRIVLIGTAYPLRGGIAHYVALLYKKLSERGHDVRVLSFKRQYPSLLFPGKTQADEGKELIPLPSTPILDSINPFSWIKAALWLKKVQPDLLIFKYWMPFFAPCYATVAFLARRLFKVKTLYILDNVIPHEKKPLDRLLTRIGLHGVDAFIAQSASVREDLLQFRPHASYRDVPHPVYEIFPPAEPMDAARSALGVTEKNVLLYFGYIRRYKGLKYLVQAMPEIRKTLGDVRLLVCGEFYEGREEILSLIDTLSLAGCVTVVDDFIPNEAVARYFSAANLVVLPYVTATQSGIVQVAYHYNKPVVVTRVGGLPEVVPHGKSGYVVEPEDPQAIAQAVIHFFQQHREDELSEGVRIEKTRYSWDRMTEAIEALAVPEV